MLSPKLKTRFGDDSQQLAENTEDKTLALPCVIPHRKEENAEFLKPAPN